MLGAGALGQPRGMVWGGRREEGSGWGTRVYLWWIHVDIWQNQYNYVKFKKKKKDLKAPSNVVGTNYTVLIYCTCHFQGGSLVLASVCWSLQCLISALTQGGGGGHFF